MTIVKSTGISIVATHLWPFRLRSARIQRPGLLGGANVTSIMIWLVSRSRQPEATGVASQRTRLSSSLPFHVVCATTASLKFPMNLARKRKKISSISGRRGPRKTVLLTACHQKASSSISSTESNSKWFSYSPKTYFRIMNADMLVRSRINKRPRKASHHVCRSNNLALSRLVDRPIVEQQAALNLAQFAQKEKDIGLGADNVEALVLGLTVSCSVFFLVNVTSALTK